MEAGAPAGSACKPTGLRNRVVQTCGGALTIVCEHSESWAATAASRRPNRTSGISRWVVGEASELTLILTGGSSRNRGFNVLRRYLDHVAAAAWWQDFERGVAR